MNTENQDFDVILPVQSPTPSSDDFDFTPIVDDNEVTLNYKNEAAADLSSPTSLQDLESQPEKQEALHHDQTGRVSNKEIPKPDYYLYEPDNPELALDNDYPVARNMVEANTKFFIERNLYAHLHATYDITFNSFQDEDIELESLAVKPPSFVIFGKSGIGATTLAMKVARKLKSVYISPSAVSTFYKTRYIPEEAGVLAEELGDKLPPDKVLSLVHWRIRELDVLHKGYVMDGIPLIQMAESMSVEDQMERMYKFPIKPQFIISMHMQDIDLFRRRSTQKYDGITGKVYTRNHFINKKISDYEMVRRRENKRKGHVRRNSDDEEVDEDSSDMDLSEYSDDDKTDFNYKEPAKAQENANGADEEDEPKDFEAIPADVIDRLYTRDEDTPMKIHIDLENFRKNMHHLERFVESCDRRKALELNAYFAPSVLLKMVLEFTDSFGIAPAPIPVKLINEINQPKMLHNLQEELGELTDTEGVLEEQPCVEPGQKYVGDTDWSAVLRACTVRGRVDPRFRVNAHGKLFKSENLNPQFRWRISRWKNLCPVALKHGRSIAGKPELAVGFMDKVYFMSNEKAFKEFQFNPRPFLLPTMPSTPVRFYVVGHPLAGKSLCAARMAKKCDAYVIDMVREVRKRMHLVKFDFLFRTRLEAVLEMTKKLDKENFQDWKRQERARREQIFIWIDDFIRRKADEAMNKTLKLEKDEIKKERERNVAAAMNHELQDAYASACQTDQGLIGFTWADFVKQIHEGKRHWTHQEKLELAWHLFHEGKLKYKISKKALLRLLRHPNGSDSSEEEEEDGEGADLSEEGEMSEDEDDEGLGSSDEEEERKKKKKRRRRPRCKRAPPSKPVTDDDEDNMLVEVESVESSVFGPSEETDESIKMRYPEIPAALVFSIPRPANVNEKHPMVEEYVLVKMCAAEKWAESEPPELYCEVLRRAINEVEGKYLQKNFRGPLSGGWIVENFAVDIEKFKACLLHPDTAPDNVIVLQDHTEGLLNILANLSKSYRTEKHNREYLHFMKEVGEAAELHGQLREFRGEAYGEDDGLSFYPFPFPKITIEKSSTEILMERLPVNDLTDSYETEQSQVTAHQRDRDRQISMADSELDITADPKKLLAEWFKTFDSKKATPISEPSTGGPYTQPKPLMEAWIAKNINYEMLTNATNLSRRIRSSEDETGNMNAGLHTLVATAQSQSNSDEKPSTGTGSSGSKRHLDFARVPTRGIIAAFHGKANIPSFLELGGEDNLKTPSGLLSLPDITCPEDGPLGPEDLPRPICIPKIHDESPKRRFLGLAKIFDDFWDMAVPILNAEQIRYFEMGVVDEDTVKEKFDIIWEELEFRWALEPVPVQESELREEIEEWEESNRLWGINAKSKMGADDELLGEFDEEIEEEQEEELSDEDESDFENENVVRDPFEKLKNKPDQYLEAVSAVDEVRLYGDLKDYCPVTLLEHGILRRGFTEFAAKYHDRIYLMASEDYLNQFLEDPAKFLPVNKPLGVPPPRICITGSPGCSQEEVGNDLAEKYQIFYVDFRRRMQELIKVKLGKKVGPDAFDFDMREGSLLGLEESDTSFVVPSLALLGTGTGARSSKASIHKNEYLGEMGGEDYGIDWQKERELAMLPVRKIGGSQTAGLATCPMNNLERTEKIAERDWTKTNKMEKAIRDFLEQGSQLPDFVLDEYIAPLWLEQPFKCKGFILVGFPNTEEDMEYMTERNFIPEFVYVVDCKFKAMRNRLLTKTVDEWHRNHPKPQKKQAKFGKAMETGDNVVNLPPEFLTEQRKSVPDLKSKLGYAANGDTWGYKDAIAHRISSLLQRYHNLYTRQLKNLKISMNRNRVRWMSIHADISVKTAELALYDNVNTALKYRTSKFESTYVLSPDEATVLIDRGFYRLSKFGRWCPVEIMNGNVAVNLWNAPGVTKIPVLYRGYIYFIAGEKNLKQFRVNVWDIVQQNCPTETMPLYVCVIGPPRSGKTGLAEKLADQLGLVHIKQDEMLFDVLKHSFVNSMRDNYNMSPDSINAGPQSMRMADEILTYLRRGHKVPQYMQFRALDLALMAPKAQFHGVVFDDYPQEDLHLQELLERGIITTVVVNLEMDNKEAYRRAELDRFDPYYNYEDFTEECENFIDYLSEDYQPLITPCLIWFEHEIRCLINMDATLSPATIYKAVEAKCFYAMNNMQRYIACGLTDKPAILEGTGPLTSHLQDRLSYLFRNYDPVALNETYDLIKVDDVKTVDLKRVVEYRKEIYVFGKEKNVQIFLQNPEKYTYPGCTHVPPHTVPIEYHLNDEEMANLEEVWGFQDFDPVYYHEGNFQYKWLKRGQSKYCAKYEHRFYFFLSAENLEKFMRKPQDYWNHPLPSRLPGKANPKPLDNLSPSGYLIASGISQDLCHILTVMAQKRPRFPFMSLAKSGVLFMGYLLKSLNMKSTSELRTHYRKAMTHMLNTQSNAEKVAKELELLHGKKTIAHETKKRLQNFMNLALKPDCQNIVDPFIPNFPFNFECADDPESTMLTDIMTDLKKKEEWEKLREVERLLKLRKDMENQENEEEEGESEFNGEEGSANGENEEYVGPPYLIKDVFSQEVEVVDF